MGYHDLFQGIFPTKGLNLGLPVIKSTEISQQDRSSASNPKGTTTDRLAVPLDRCEAGKNVPGVSVVKSLPANARGLGLIPGLGRLPGEGNGPQLQYSCLENSMDRGENPMDSPWVTKGQTRLSN